MALLTHCVRRALDCLLDLPSSIPYASLFPYKKTVAKALLVRSVIAPLAACCVSFISFTDLLAALAGA